MYQLTLEWFVVNQGVSQTLSSQDNTKVPGSIRIGRDNARCDVVLKHPDPSIEKTVSGLHAEIFFEPRMNCFCIRNLTRDRQPPVQPNPIVVDGQKLIMQEMPLHVGSQIKLGKMTLIARAIEISAAEAQPIVNAQPIDPRYALKCGNVREPHFWPLDYQKLTCETCGRAILGATLILNRE
jgi:hypothetical protein